MSQFVRYMAADGPVWGRLLGDSIQALNGVPYMDRIE